MKNREPGPFPADAAPGDFATAVCAGGREGFSGAALLARTIANTPPNERTIRGLA
jgi:hypothetical protein